MREVWTRTEGGEVKMVALYGCALDGGGVEKHVERIKKRAEEQRKEIVCDVWIKEG